MIEKVSTSGFWRNGDRYEGEYKNGEKGGNCKKEMINFLFIYSNIVWID